MKKRSIAIISALVLSLSLSACGGSEGGVASKGGQSQNAVESVLDQQIAAEENSGAKTGTVSTEAVTQAPTTEASTQAPTTEAPTQAPTTEAVTQTSATEASTQAYTSPATNDRYDPFAGVDPTPIKDPDPTVDIDLTSMNRDMVYATVLQMMNVPEDYEGKTVKVEGEYYTSFYDVTNQYYHYVIIKDALACCAQGLEFVWEDGTHTYPDEYPNEGTRVLIVGTYETYQDPGDPNIYVHLKDSTMTMVPVEGAAQ